MAAGGERFPFHRGVAPMLWAFATLVLLEMLVVELVMAGRWPALSWFLLATSLLSLIWLVYWIMSLKRLPHRIDRDELILSYGAIRKVEVPLDRIQSVRGDFASEELKGKNVRNFVPLAYPNRLITIDPPIVGRKGPISKIAVRFDDPAEFDAALEKRGIGKAD